METARLRAEFPVLSRLAYLNAGSVGPMPAVALAAARAELDLQIADGRGTVAYFERATAHADAARAAVAALIGAPAAEVALTGATTGGVNTVVAGLDLRRGDEIVTSDEEHPGLIAPLLVARERHGIEVRVVPFDAVADAVGPATRLVACSHVSWLTGRIADTAALAACDAPVLLDGAQGLGAIAVDVSSLGCDYYAGSGQKWLCGPVGSGYLWVHHDRLDGLSPIAAGYSALADPDAGFASPPAEGAARLDTGTPATHDGAWAVAALELLAGCGWEHVFAAARSRAAELAGALAAGGRTVAPRHESTLVAWESADNERESGALLDQGLLVRHIPGTPYVRASVGAWTSADEIRRLLAATCRSS